MSLEPRATYRLQLRPGFGLDQAKGLASYLSELGISHLYTSPFLQAANDSTHGYDIVDPSKINVQLGDDASFQLLCKAIQAASMGLMLDVVPNHMAILGKQNPWWWDVLEDGPSSPFATYFDVDWAASEERWHNKILLPVLEDHYGRVLEDQQFNLVFLEGDFVLQYHDTSFPIDPSSLTEFLGRVADKTHSEMLMFIAESYARLPRPTVTSRRALERRHRDKAILRQILMQQCHEEPHLLAAIQEEMQRLNHDPDAIDRLIQQQNYRLSFWRTANRDLGYRRFFDIKDLAGLRMEDDEVFCAVHALPLKWYKEGKIQALRVDHPDGLKNPKEYFLRLRKAFFDAWIVAEKILETGETLPSDWNISGTTGYDFLNLLTTLYIHPDAEDAFNRIYQEFIGEKITYSDLVYACKCLVISELFGSEINRLTHLLTDICEKHRCYRDYTRVELKQALSQLAACYPVYRTYVSLSESVSKQDERTVATATECAIKKSPDSDEKLFGFLKGILLLRIPGAIEGELVQRFQQFTGPVMAKGFEDTALYRYNRFLALNEVGGNPSLFGSTLKTFHETCLQAQKQRPLSLLASTTHDTKRSEDVRARLTLLSEIPSEWEKAVARWRAQHEQYRFDNLPDRNTQYFLYQTLVGAWPIEEKRLLDYMEKSVREAKEHTSWVKPNEHYEGRLQHFIKAILEDKTFLADLENFVTPLLLPGRINGLAQTLIKLTAPGVPDIYQGCELWNMSLVDPDNRKEVDFIRRIELLKQLRELTLDQIMARMEEGLPKLWVIAQTLNFRKQRPELFVEGSYQPMYAQGDKADHVIAYMRGDAVITIVPRFFLRLNHNWGDTAFELPKGTWYNLLKHEDEELSGQVPMQEMFKSFPVALLINASFGSS